MWLCKFGSEAVRLQNTRKRRMSLDPSSFSRTYMNKLICTKKLSGVCIWTLYNVRGDKPCKDGACP